MVREHIALDILSSFANTLLHTTNQAQVRKSPLYKDIFYLCDKVMAHTVPVIHKVLLCTEPGGRKML